MKDENYISIDIVSEANEVIESYLKSQLPPKRNFLQRIFDIFRKKW